MILPSCRPTPHGPVGWIHEQSDHHQDHDQLGGWNIDLHDKLGDFHGKKVALVKISYMDPLGAKKWKHLFFKWYFCPSWFWITPNTPPWNNMLPENLLKQLPSKDEFLSHFSFNIRYHVSNRMLACGSDMNLSRKQHFPKLAMMEQS